MSKPAAKKLAFYRSKHGAQRYCNDLQAAWPSMRFEPDVCTLWTYGFGWLVKGYTRRDNGGWCSLGAYVLARPKNLRDHGWINV